MKALIDVGHPAHVHFFRPVRERLEAEGHQVLVSARDKDVVLDLLRAFGIPHQVVAPGGPSYAAMGTRLLRLAALARRVRPTVMAAIGGAFVAPAARMAGVPSLVFTDTEHVKADRLLTYPWATRICTPCSFRNVIGSHQVRYDGLHELAYLRPGAAGTPETVRRELGLGEDERFAIVRLVAWTADHDRGQRGLSSVERAELCRRLRPFGRVFVSVEGAQPLTEGEPLPIPAHRMHQALAAASLYVGEGATMATEAALLGTPSVYVSSLAGTMGNFDLLVREGLVRTFSSGGPAIAEAVAVMGDAGAKAAWTSRAAAFAARHVDVVDFACSQFLAVSAR